MPNGHPPEMSPVAPRPGDEIRYELPKETTVIVDDSFARKAEQRLDRIEQKLDWLRWAIFHLTEPTTEKYYSDKDWPRRKEPKWPA